MNDRMITALGALFALVLVVGLFVQKPAEPSISRPTSVEIGPNGYQALRRWLDAQFVATHSFRERYDKLVTQSNREAGDDIDGANPSTIPPTGNLLVTTLPHSRQTRSDEVADLMAWVARGNTLVVMAALNDTPDWSAVTPTDSFLDDLEGLSGTRFEAATDEEGESILAGELLADSRIFFEATEEGSDEHPLMAGVASLSGQSNSVASIWIPTEGSTGPGEAIARETGTGLAAAWADPVADGHVITVASGSLFTNRALGDEDNRRLLANLIRWHLSPDGVVIFDDMHQGLSTLYDPDAFYSDPRVAVTVFFLLCFWFVYMVGTNNRTRPVVEITAEPRQGDFVSAIGGFMARKLTPAAAGLLMFDRWFNQIRSRWNPGWNPAPEQLPWEHLAASPMMDSELVRSLERSHTRLVAGQKVDLSQLHNTIQRAREAMG